MGTQPECGPREEKGQLCLSWENLCVSTALARQRRSPNRPLLQGDLECKVFALKSESARRCGARVHARCCSGMYLCVNACVERVNLYSCVCMCARMRDVWIGRMGRKLLALACTLPAAGTAAAVGTPGALLAASPPKCKMKQSGSPAGGWNGWSSGAVAFEAQWWTLKVKTLPLVWMSRKRSGALQADHIRAAGGVFEGLICGIAERHHPASGADEEEEKQRPACVWVVGMGPPTFQILDQVGQQAEEILKIKRGKWEDWCRSGLVGQDARGAAF
eukprot:1151186-Pelagomonas_calceolata.AAC.7